LSPWRKYTRRSTGAAVDVLDVGPEVVAVVDGAAL
jgi:hypothetical protein